MAFIASDSDSADLVLESAILLYKERHHYSSSGKSGAFASIHPVEIRDERPFIMPGRPATKSGVRAALASLAGRAQSLPCLLDPDVLGAWDSGFAFYVKAQSRMMFVKNEENGVSGARVVPHPGLIFLIDEGKWWVWAFKGKSRPTARTLLYRAPYPNVFNDAGICTGSTRLPDREQAADVSSWAEAFFGSNFTHYQHLDRGRHVCHEGGPYAFLRDWWDGKFATFPQSALSRFDKSTLGEVIKSLARGKCAHGNG